MTKKIINSNYKFDASAGKVTIHGFAKVEDLLIITDVTNNKIIYNFADATRGADSASFNEATEETTITLAANLTGLGCSDSDNLQIIIDKINTTIDFHESYVDPVHKIRVSTPENLIDTDFEYGLQPTKWETLELSNNVPSFYVSEGDLSLPNVRTVEAINGSNIIRVNTDGDTGLAIGTPVDVQGLNSRTAEGKFLITSTDSNGFTYQASTSQTVTGAVNSLYTAITPGTFYTGSSIQYDPAAGLTTDNRTVDSGGSTISIHTVDEHGFQPGSNFYLVNTVGQRTTNLTGNVDSDAADGRPVVDDSDRLSTIITLDQTKTNTNQIRSRHHLKFGPSAVNVTNDIITWTAHGMKNNDTVMYLAPPGDTIIGGLTNFQVFWVIVVDANTIKLSSSVSGAPINLTSTGTSNYGTHSLHLVYEVYQIYQQYRSSYTRWGTRSYHSSGSGSGWDLRDAMNGLGTGTVVAYFPFFNNYNNANQYYWANRNSVVHFGQYHSSNFVLGTTNNPPSIYNFVEDWTRFSTQSWAGQRYNAMNGNTDHMLTFKSYYDQRTTTFNGTTNANSKCYLFPVVMDEEADTLFSTNHGLSTGNSINLTTTAGNAPLIHNGTTSYSNSTSPTNLADGDYTVEKVSNDRFKLQSQRVMRADGTYTLSGIVNNPTGNSFYLPDHGFNQNQEVTFSVGGGGTVPGSQSGQVLPNYSSSSTTSTLPKYYEVINDAIDDFISTNSMTTNDLVTSNGHAGNSTQFLTSGVASGLSPINQANFRYSGWYYANSATGTLSDIPAANLYVENFSPTQPFNLLKGTTHNVGGRELSMVATKWERNTTVDKVLWVTGAKRGNDAEMVTVIPRVGMSFPSAGSMMVSTGDTFKLYTATNGSGNQYRWASNFFVHRYNNLDFTYIQVKFKNYSDWQSYSASTYMSSTTNNNTYYYANGSTSSSYRERDELTFGVMLMLPSTQTQLDANAEFTSFVEHILEYFDVNAVYNGLTSGNNYNVNVLNANRFQLKAGSTVNLTDGGTAPFEFQSRNVLGIIDGAYTADSAEGTTINFATPTQQVGGNQATSLGTVSYADTITIADGGVHSFASGTEVTYSTDSDGAAYGGLTNNNNYFINVVDDKNIKLADTADNGVSGADVLNITSGDPNATHTFVTESLAGIVKAVGTITTTAEKAIIEGTETLFKRYFKPGDNIYILDNSTTPGNIDKYEVTTVPSDTKLTVSQALSFTNSDTSHYVETKVYAKPDGYSVHRPFDGGVEIAAGTAPGSQITRQTRKYFRYQSGKGIQTSLAINFNPPVTVNSLTGINTTATVVTKYPHRLTTGLSVQVKDASDTTYNGIFQVTVVDDFTFTYTTESSVITSVPGGIIKYNVRGYSGAYTRAGMFDYQNGFFLEYDGATLNCVRRSSVEQISGTATATNNRGLITGNNTKFISQLAMGDMIVIRGQSHKVVKINSNTELYVQPQYKGASANGIILTKTIDVKVPQSEWNVDKCDGSGPEGFVLDIDKIQMAYMDYSWYGAGKIRFGFKDREGHVRYVHQFIHNNRLDEAYMRSGNLPAKYEIENGINPDFAPTLFHWGTSVIMDGTFDDDKAYLFTAQGKPLTFTNGDINEITTTGNSALTYTNSGNWWVGRNWYVRIPIGAADASSFYSGAKLYTVDGALSGQEVAYTQYSGNTFYVYIFIQTSKNTPASYPSVASGTAISVGAAPAGANGDTDVDLGTDVIPLVSLRLAPSVDGNLTGALGQRDIINRMQMQLNETGLILTHDCEVKLIINGNLSNTNWEQVQNPSLSELIAHDGGDTVSGGTEIFSFRASGGTTDNTGKRLSNTSDFKLDDIIDLGNSILGGDGVFPNGPDILTIAVKVVDTGDINADNPFKTSSRITWSESQA